MNPIVLVWACAAAALFALAGSSPLWWGIAAALAMAWLISVLRWAFE